MENREYGSLNDIMHYDQHMVITYLVRGTGNISVEGNNTIIQEGDLIILNPHEFHRCFFDKHPQHERISIYIKPSIAEGLSVTSQVLFGAFNDRPLGKGNLVPAKVIQELKISRLLESLQCPEDGDMDADVIMQCKIIQLLILLKQAVKLTEQEPVQRKENKSISNAIEYINSHLTEELSTSSIATLLFLDKSYLCRVFKQYTGATLNEYITQKRIEFAIQLMDSGVSCTDACYKSGFGNYSSFYKYYKRYTGNIPNRSKSNTN